MLFRSGPLPKEREPFSTDFLIYWTITLSVTAKPFSLSLRERAGVRGKSASNCIDRAEAGVNESHIWGNLEETKRKTKCKTK